MKRESCSTKVNDKLESSLLIESLFSCPREDRKGLTNLGPFVSPTPRKTRLHCPETVKKGVGSESSRCI